MYIGLGVPQIGHFADPTRTLATARQAEQIGFNSLWVLDRLLTPIAPRTPYPASADGELPPEQATVLDPLVTLTAAATVTERIRIGTSVLVAPWYPPVLLARSLASLDVFSNGRLDVGMGLGWSVDEYEAVGAPKRDLANRLEEVLEVLHMVWNFDVVDIETTRERIASSHIGLRPVQRPRPPILLAAYSPAGFERIARRADGWTPAGVPAEAVGAIWQGILESTERHGRDASQMRLVERANLKVTDAPLGSDRPVYVGSIDQVRSDIERIAEIGAHEIILELQGAARDTDEMFEIADTLAGDFIADQRADASRTEVLV